MKKSLIIFFVTTIFFFTSSCRDESLDPLLPIKAKIGLVNGELIYPDETFIEISSPDDVIVNMYVTSPEDKVDSFTLRGKIRIGSEWTEYTALKTITNFPAEVTITAQELSDAVGISLDDIPNYSRFSFMGVSESEGYIVDLDVVVGHGFSPDDNPDGVASGLISAYIERTHILRFQ